MVPPGDTPWGAAADSPEAGEVSGGHACCSRQGFGELRRERPQLLDSTVRHDMRGFRYLLPRPAKVAQRLRHHEAGVVGNDVQRRVVRVLAAERGDLGAVEERPGVTLA